MIVAVVHHPALAQLFDELAARTSHTEFHVVAEAEAFAELVPLGL